MIDQWIKDALKGGTKVVIDYENGAFFTASQPLAFIRYNTGDCVWFRNVDGTYQVSRIETHDEQLIEC